MRKKNTNTDAHREEILKRKREAERVRRQRIRDDPNKHEIYLQKERERNQKRKCDGKIKCAAELTVQEKKNRRKKQSEYKRNSRMRIKIQNAASVQENNKVNDKIMSKQAKVGVKRIAKDRRKCYRDNKKLIEERDRLKRTVDKLRKRLQRSKVKKSGPNSPNSNVKKLLHGRRVDADIRQRLISNEVVTQQLRDSYRNSKSDNFKQIMGRVLTGKIIRKYRKLTFVKKQIVRVDAHKIPPAVNPIKFIRKQKESLRFMTDKVKQFFNDNSNVNPGKKNCKKIDGKLVSKQYMTASIKDLHIKFCAESSFRVSYSFFAKHRPSYCVAPKVTERETCACFVHENFALLLIALHRTKVIKENSTEKLISAITCIKRSEECLSRTCTHCQSREVEFNLQCLNSDDDEMSYMKWETSTVKRLNEKTQKPISVITTKKNKIICKIYEGVELFRNDFKHLIAHEFRIAHQRKALRGVIESLCTEEMFLMIDFSENYSIKYGSEVQAVHFGASREQYTLHTGMLYTSGFSQGFTTLSQSLRHDPVAILVHLIKILDVYLLKFPTVKKLHFQSDGPTTQYRNRKMFYLVTQYLPQKYQQIKQLTYNFTEAGHGKGPADGIGGRLKKSADDEVKYGHDIPNFNTLVSTLRTRVTAVHLDVVTKEEIESMDSVLPSQVKPFVGTMKVHQYCWTRENSTCVRFNALSCFDCPPGITCSHFAIGLIDHKSLPALKRRISKPKATTSQKAETMIKNKVIKSQKMR